MQQPHKDNLPGASICRRLCPICGQPMFMVSIEPTDKRGCDQHTFECSSCACVETMLVQLE